jgi:uncharacterized protein with von Willebrand factor type A (vWA) domain
VLPVVVILLAAGRDEADLAAIDPLPPCVEGAPAQVTIAVFDVSSSVIDSSGADPGGRSFEEAKLLARALAEQPCTSDDRMGAVIFASTFVEVPPIPLSSLSVIESAITRPPDSEIGGGTNLSGALELTAAIADRYPNHQVTVVVLSDMQVDDTAEVRTSLARLSNHSLHLVALGEYDPRLDAAFETVSPPINRVRPGDVANALANAIAHPRKETHL